MHHQEFTPPTVLQDAIKCFWYHKKESEELRSGFEVIPDGYAEIIFYFGELYSSDQQLIPSPFMVGLLNQPVIFYAKGPLEIIGIRCFPWTVFDLPGLTAGKSSKHIFENPLARLQSTLYKNGNIAEAIAQLTDYFLQARSRISLDSMLFKAGVAMQKANGTLPVSQVAAAAHATVRTLERKFKQSAGHTVKDVSGLMRFEQVRNELWLHPDTNLAGLAHELGYADQAHLSKEFKRYSSITPAAFARKARKRQQAVSKDFVAFASLCNSGNCILHVLPGLQFYTV